MLFNSLQYALFLPLVVLAYYLSPRPLRPALLLLASYIFYASWDARFLVLIIGLTAANYLAGRLLARLHGRPRASAWVLGAAIALNLGVLAYFKYALFLLTSVVGALARIGIGFGTPSVSIILPLGISFFVFEFIHYLVDVRGGQPAIRSPLTFALFAAFFPTQIAGPIKRYEAFIPQVEQPAVPVRDRFGAGVRLLVVGLFKKVALADNLALMTTAGFGWVVPGGSPPRPGDVWLVVLAFALQIYFDFSGYTDMGRGSALLFGFAVPENFRRPYLATNVSDFWRRWHISLSSWLRDYLYIPLGGSRRRRYRNLLLTMTLGGLWHGANWTFVVWGVFHGGLLALYWWSRPWLTPWIVRAIPWRPLRALLSWAVTLVAICVGWVFFRSASLEQAFTILGALSGWRVGDVGLLIFVQRWFIVVVAVGCLAIESAQEWGDPLRAGMGRLRGGRFLLAGGRELRPLYYVALVVLIVLLRPGEGSRFIYFQF